MDWQDDDFFEEEYMLEMYSLNGLSRTLILYKEKILPPLNPTVLLYYDGRFERCIYMLKFDGSN